MIEKFSKEELKIIREELSELPKRHQKRTLCDEEFRKLHKAINDQTEYNGIYKHELDEAVLAIADYTLCNYEKNMRYNSRRAYRRAVNIPPSIGDDYKKIVGQIVDVIAENVRMVIPDE